MTTFRRPIALLVLLLSGAFAGCVSDLLARKIVTAPNRQSKPWPAKGSQSAQPFEQTYAQQFRVPIGPPAAELAVAIIEPGDYQFNYGVAQQIQRDQSRAPKVVAEWEPHGVKATAPARGTIVLLHGFLVTRETMMHWALFFAQQGYRAVLVDLRGHGQSTGEWITFGVGEADDLTKVLDDLARRGLVAGSVGVLGSSYGAVVALDWASRDPRVAAAVALQPFSDPEAAVREFAAGFPPFHKQLAYVSAAAFERALQKAPVLAGFTWRDANVIAAVKKIRIPVLFIHGADDTWISPEHSRRLAAAAPAGSRLLMSPGDNHETLSARLEPIAEDVAEWFIDHGLK